MVDFAIKSGDRLPEIVATLTEAGQPVNLTGATVRFWMATVSSRTIKVAGSIADILDAPNGRVRYAWTAADTDTPGEYYAEWQVTFSDGRSATYPSDGYLLVQVRQRLAG